MLEQREKHKPEFEPLDWRECDGSLLLQRIAEANIVGMGGAGYSSFQKIRSGLHHGVEHVLANAVECEPGVNVDFTLLKERPEDVIEGLEIVGHIVQSKELTLVASSRSLLTELSKSPHSDVNISIVPNSPSSGEERQLISHVFNQQIPPESYPTQFGFLVFNVATLFAICESVRDGRSPRDRVVSIDSTPQWVNIGSHLNEVLEETNGLRLGSQATGAPATKHQVIEATTNAISLDRPHAIKPCIHCGQCNQSCPRVLDVEKMYMFSEVADQSTTLFDHYLSCFECGACVVECPSAIPLLDYIRKGRSQVKREIKKREALARFDRHVERLDLDASHDDASREKRMQTVRNW